MNRNALSVLLAIGVGSLAYAITGEMFGMANPAVIIGSIGFSLLSFCAAQLE
jgi:hypothetical protein